MRDNTQTMGTWKQAELLHHVPGRRAATQQGTTQTLRAQCSGSGCDIISVPAPHTHAFTHTHVHQSLHKQLPWQPNLRLYTFPRAAASTCSLPRTIVRACARVNVCCAQTPANAHITVPTATQPPCSGVTLHSAYTDFVQSYIYSSRQKLLIDSNNLGFAHTQAFTFESAFKM